MKNKALSLDKIRKVGMDALARALGPIDLVRFLQQFDLGKGDCTREREKWLGRMGIKEIKESIERRRKPSH